MQGDAVDASAPLMLSVSEIARMKGVSKQGVAKRVDRFEARGQIVTEMVRGQRLVPLAIYDQLVGETTDLSRSRSGAPSSSRTETTSVSASGSYTAEQARKMRYEADLKEIELGKQLGQVLLVADVERAMTKCAEIMVRKIDQMPSLADEIAAAVGQGGALGARTELKRIAVELRRSLANAMKLEIEADAAGNEEDDH